MGEISIIQASILGLVQGLGEFLPISSSGHLALLQKFFNVDGDKVIFFAVMLHLGTLISVLIVYWKDIFELLRELFYVFKDIFTGKGLDISKNETRREGFLILVATIPTAIIGILFEKVFESFYTSLIAIGVGLIITGTILFIAERNAGGNKRAKNMMFRNAVFIGIMQGIAIAPGVSRSGSTLFGGLVSRLDRAFAVKFAFLISIPSILGSVVLELPKALKEGFPLSLWIPIIIGMIVAAISGLIAIKVMIKLVSNKKLTYFSLYTWALGIIAIILGIF